MYKLSRYWNRLAYFFIHLGRKMIWEYTSKNKLLLDDMSFANKYVESIICDKEVK